MATKKKLLQAAAGNAGGGAGLDVDDVFSTYLYEGNGTSQSIDNGIDLSGEGGMTWIKSRDISGNNTIFDTARTNGFAESLYTNTTGAVVTGWAGSVDSTGFNLGVGYSNVNASGSDYASWTFRKAPRFFDVVTWTGDGANNRKISHNLGSVPGCYIVKQINDGRSWNIYHRGLNNGNSPEDFILTFDTDAQTDVDYWNDTAPTATEFTINNYTPLNENGGNYVAYLFAHNDGDGEFGPDGDADIIKCGSYTGNGSTTGPVIDLGFEPQWLLIKNTTSGGTDKDWVVIDSMRGFNLPSINTALLTPNSSSAETASGLGGSGDSYVAPSGEGFQPINDRSQVNTSGDNYIYVAIRRGPLAVPESGSDVFFIDTYDSSATPPFTTTATIDFAFRRRVHRSDGWSTGARMIDTRSFRTENANEEDNSSLHRWDYNNGWGEGSFPSSTYSWMWKRAPSYFDVVGYTGNSTAGRTVSHNLGVAPEMMWVKKRSSAGYWRVYHKSLNGGTNPEQYGLNLNETVAEYDDNLLWNDTAPTASVFSLGTQGNVNFSGTTYIAYLFASLDGVSKLGSVSHTTGSNTDVDCGFSAGARFVILKGADLATGWLVFDSTRGIISGNSPSIALNSSSAEDSSQDKLDPYSSGFSVGPDIATGTWIYYAIA
jgi:hypothetical protein